MKCVEQSRRDFLKMTGKGMVGAAALSMLPMSAPAFAEGAEAPEFPLKWQPIDKDVAMKHGYDCFYTHGGCGAATAAGILETLAEQYGYPYNQFNARMFAAYAGGFGNQTLCGSLGSGTAIIGLFCAGADANTVRNDLYAWYKGHAFPEYKPEIDLGVTTVAESIQCSDSVGKYMAATGLQMGDDGRKARCAAVAGETARKIVELLNVFYGYEAAPVVEEAAPAAELAANEYIGVGKSEIGGDVKVKVTMDGDKIAKIEVLSHNETPGVSDPAFAGIPEAIIAAQSTEVDVITGATKTSDALIAAVNDALSQIKK